MIEILKTNGVFDRWNEEDYTDYLYDGKCFIIVQGNKWVGIYNLNSIDSIVIK